MKLQKELEKMQSEYETLANSVQKTLTNFQSKKDFLVEQQHFYSVIRDKLTALKSKGKGAKNDEESEKGEIFGDIIISANKVFLNIGYEYYVEKTTEEALDFVLDKLQLMEDAVVQFDGKIDEANNTLRNLKAMIEHAPQSGATGAVPVKSNNIQTQSNNTPEQFEDSGEGSLPTMEIREELDEDGNVVSGSVVPAATEKDRKQIEDLLENKIAPKLGADIPQKNEVSDKGDVKFDSSFEKSLQKNIQHVEKKADTTVDDTTPDLPEGGRNVDAKDLYTFSDLVAQMDKVDAEEDDEDFDPDDLNYDYDNYKGIDSHGYVEDEDDEDEEYNFSDDDIAYQKMPGHSSLMDQINKLRAARGQQYPAVEENNDEVPVATEIIEAVEEVIEKIPSSASISAPEKSILKKENTPKPKKSVGFAPSLDVHEVESFKEETKKQTFNFPRRGEDLYSMVQDIMTDDTNNPNLHEFDSDLFASMIGAKTSEELHDKYHVESGDNAADGVEEEEGEVRKPRVSRFKRDKQSRGGSHTSSVEEKATTSNAPTISDTIVERDVISETAPKDSEEPVRAVSDLIVEREIIVDEDVPVAPKKKLSKFAKRKANMNATHVSNTSTKPLPVEEPVSSGIVERNVTESAPQKQAPINQNIVEHVTSQSPPQKKTPSLFKKSMGSLSQPRPPRNTQKPFPQELMDASSDEEEEEKEKAASPLPKIEDLGDVVETQPKPKTINTDSIFPKEVQAAIAEAGKTEDSVRVANVDYSALVDNMDDMIQAYSLGAYDDDLEEHPGTVVERVEDFAQYNHQVNELRDDILEFKRNNPMVPIDAEGIQNGDEDEDDTPGIMSDVVEKDIPADYKDIEEGYEGNLGLLPDNLAKAVDDEYRSLRSKMVGMMRDMTVDDKSSTSDTANGATVTTEAPQAADPSIEPLDSEGNPVRISRFRSQRKNLYPQSHITERV